MYEYVISDFVLDNFDGITTIVIIMQDSVEDIIVILSQGIR